MKKFFSSLLSGDEKMAPSPEIQFKYASKYTTILRENGSHRWLLEARSKLEFTTYSLWPVAR